MFETIGVPELLIIGLVVVLLFGVGKIGRLGKDLGEGVKEFRRAMKDDDTASPGSAPLIPAPPVTATTPFAPAQQYAPPPAMGSAPTVQMPTPAPASPTRSGPAIF